MATYRITYEDKDKNAPLGSFESQWLDDDANEVKRVINALSDYIQPSEDGPGGGSGGGVGDKHVVITLEDDTEHVITHGFGKKPAVQVFGLDWAKISVFVKHNSDNEVLIAGNKSFTGYAVLN